MPTIHPTAIVQTGAQLADDVVIDANAHVSAKAKLAAGVHVMQGAGIYGDTSIGCNTKIYPYALVGTPPQDIGYTSEDDVSLIIGENCIIREFATINAGTKKGGGTTKVDDDCFVMTYCHIAHDCCVGKGVIMANNATLAGHVSIGAHTVIGGMTPIHQFVNIGEYCMIGGASAISQDIPPYCLAEGNRAVVKGLNAVGLKRNFEKDDIRALQHAYKELFRTSKPIKVGAQKILDETNNEKVINLCEFILKTSRGIPYERKM